jgi:HD-like signal output (HDOD) protein
VCALSTREAIDQMSKGLFDLVLAAVSGPGIDGVALLDDVAARQPWAARFLLAGPGEKALLLRAGTAAHQHLLKPLRTADLFARMARTMALGDLLGDDTLRSLVSKLKSIPSPPAIYLSLVAELRKDEASPRKVGELVARDSGMAAKILQLVNSPFFGLRMRVVDPVQAAQLLGLETVRGLVLSAHIFEQVELKIVTRFQLARVWRHSLAAAGCARVVARMQSESPEATGEAFTAALLHDVGKLVLARSLPNDYADVLAQAEADQVPTWVAEREMLGTTHAEVAAYLLSLWGLPTGIVEAVAWHHRPSAYPVSAFGALGAVHAANAIEHTVHPGDAIGIPSGTDEEYLARLSMPDRLPTWSAACLELQ